MSAIPGYKTAGSGLLRKKMYIAISLVWYWANFSDKFERYMKKELKKMITYAGPRNTFYTRTELPISNMHLISIL